MTHTRPRRRTVRQCMQIFFTEAFTFMLFLFLTNTCTYPTRLRRANHKCEHPSLTLSVLSVRALHTGRAVA